MCACFFDVFVTLFKVLSVSIAGCVFVNVGSMSAFKKPCNMG